MSIAESHTFDKACVQHSLPPISYFAGLALGLPIAYPEVPFYLVGYAMFGMMALLFFYNNNRIEFKKVLLIVSAMAVSLLSNLYSINHNAIQPSRIAFTTFYFVFFFFGCFVPDKKSLIRGFTAMSNLLSLSVIGSALVIRPWSTGILMFSIPESRLWGFNLFPDWPNFLAFMLSIGFILNLMVYKRRVFALISISAALLTTSRTPLLAIGIVMIVSIVTTKKKVFKYTMAILCVAIIAILGGWLASSFSEGTDFAERLLVFDDRSDIYSYSIKLFMESPIIGMGSVLMDQSVGHEGFASFHNSYLDILVRHGIVGFLLFASLIWPARPYKNVQSQAYWVLIFFFVMGACFQNFFKHPHLIMLYSAIISSRGSFYRELYEE